MLKKSFHVVPYFKFYKQNLYSNYNKTVMCAAEHVYLINYQK